MMQRERPGNWAHFFGLWLAMGASLYAWPQGDETVQYPLKLAFIYNLTKFVEWPPEAFSSPSAPVVLCIAGRDPFPADAERELRARTTRGRPVDIRKIRTTDSPVGCHVVFISDAEQKNAASIFAGANDSSALTVGESRGFVERGGIVSLVIKNANIHFEINTEAAERKHLTISSRVLALARIVYDRRTEGDAGVAGR